MPLNRRAVAFCDAWLTSRLPLGLRPIGRLARLPCSPVKRPAHNTDLPPGETSQAENSNDLETLGAERSSRRLRLLGVLRLRSLRRLILLERLLGLDRGIHDR